MAESLHIDPQSDKAGRYAALYPQLRALMEGEKDSIANLANFCAALQQTFGWLWVGFYRLHQGELVLGPFQGPLACTRIAYGRGVCGSAWAQNQILVVPDVELFPGHIACSSLSRSEIVLPLHNSRGEVVGVLDVDAAQTNVFDSVDAEQLQRCLQLLDKDLPFWKGTVC